MMITEIFDGSNPTKLINTIDKMFTTWSNHLHLAHTKQGYRDKNDHFKLAKEHFYKLRERHDAGVDVTQELKDFKKQIRSSVNNI